MAPAADFPQPDYERECVRLYCGDCLDILPQLPEGCVDAVVTDPPYFQPATHYCPTRDEGAPQRAYADLSILEHFFKSLCGEFARVTAPHGAFYLFCDGQSYHMAFAALFPHTKRVRPLVWDKCVSFNGYTWRHQHELIAWGERDESPRVPTGDGDILKCRAVPVKARVHPAQKPVELVERLVEKVSLPKGYSIKRPSDICVLDAFMGSAATGAACVKAQRQFIGIEKEPKYFDIAVERIEKAFEDQALFAEGAA